MFVKNREVQKVVMADGVERKVLGYGNGIMVAEVEFKKDAIAALHSHVHEQVSYIVKGTFEFIVGGKKQILETGDSAYIPSGVQHQVTALTDGIVTDSFSPMREDFI